MNNALTGFIIVLMIIIYLLFIKSIGFIEIQNPASTSHNYRDADILWIGLSAT